MAPDDALYGIKRQRRMDGNKQVSSSTFASQLGSLINSKVNNTTSQRSSRERVGKEDIFRAHSRNAAASKRARTDADAQQPFGQKHTINGDGVDTQLWNRSKRRLEDKARLYSAIKRGDVEDDDERYAVDFDRKWIEDHGDDGEENTDEDEEEAGGVEYLDEFGRTRTGTRAEAARAKRQLRSQADLDGDRFTARPTAPSNVIFGDTIQHQAFNPDAHVEAQMEAIAKKRDRSLTPPPDLHFDSAREIRQKGTGFFAFSDDAGRRRQQMDELDVERATTERKRREREEQLRKDVVERDREFQEDDIEATRKRKADDFLAGLDKEIRQKQDHGMDAMQRIEAALMDEDVT